MARVKIKIPSRFIVVNKETGTVAARGPKGRFKGRRGPDSRPRPSNPYLYPYHGPGDTTKARRILHDIDLDKDGKTDLEGGTIYGRTIKVKASGRAKGYEKRV